MNTSSRITLLASSALAALAPEVAPVAAAQAPEFETRQIVEGVYVFRHRAHNAMFVVTGDGVVAFDPISPEAARIYRDEIAAVTSEPIRYIVYSHHHADHVSGAAELAPDAEIIAQANALVHLAAEPNPAIPLPTITFETTMRLRVGSRTIDLHYLGRNHSDNSVVAHLPEERLIFAVDFVASRRVAYRDLPGFYLPDLWESLERLQQLDYQTAVFGHGEPGTKSDVYDQIKYWADLRLSVESVIDAGLGEDEAVGVIDLPDYSGWGGYDDWFKMNARAVYQHFAAAR